jgi:hypothetical protein
MKNDYLTLFFMAVGVFLSFTASAEYLEKNKYLKSCTSFQDH